MASAVLLFCSSGLRAQVPDYIMQASDGAFFLEVYRSGNSVKLMVQLTNSTEFSYVTIERSLDDLNSFSQCKYFVPTQEKTMHGAIIKEDVYAISSSKDMYYRIKTVSKDGVSRTYPPVRLPAPGTEDDTVARLPK
ncbi:MAG: hypothetical protein U0V74_10920 [Chitinophagales bacterium]